MNEVNDPYLRHLFDSFSKSDKFNVYEKDVINLSIGAPGPDLLNCCGDMMMKATTHRWQEEKKEEKYYLYQYGITAGLWECRDELSKFLTRKYGDPVAREHLILNCGATHGIQLLLTTVIAPNGIIFVEDLTYMIALEVFRQFPLMKIVSVPIKEDSIDLDIFEKLVKQENKENFAVTETKLFWAMLYTMPTFHNPIGKFLEPEKCHRLVKLARKYDFVVACDDVYNLLYYEDGFPPHRLFYYDDPKDPEYKGGNVISNGTFSKILFPAVRLGWMECCPRVANIFRESGIMKSGGAVNHYVSGVIASLLHLNLEDEYLDKLVKIYKERLHEICVILDKSLPRNCSYCKPKGGYFVWIKLPNGIDGSHFNIWCQKYYKVVCIPGSHFSYTGNSKNFLRISFSFHSVEFLKQAIQSLCTGLSFYIKDQLGETYL